MASQFIYSLNVVIYAFVRTTRGIFIIPSFVQPALFSLAVDGDYVDFR